MGGTFKTRGLGLVGASGAGQRGQATFLTTLVAECRYDGLHRRITKLIPDGENWDRTDYYYTTSWQACLPSAR